MIRARLRGALAWLRGAEAALAQAAPRLDALNLFPVPDADTGSNMLATVRAARQAAERSAGTDMSAVLRDAGAAALDSARGNSGTLLAVALVGLAAPLTPDAPLTTAELAAGARAADRAARAALSDPREGTILTVLREAATVLEAAAAGGREPAEALGSVVEAARRAVEDTEGQLAPLTRARVVDAGAVGLLLVLEALRAEVTRTPFDEGVVAALHGWADGPGAAGEDPQADGREAPGVEVMCSIDLTPVDAAGLRRGLEEAGDSVILAPLSRAVDGAGRLRWRVHVHVARAEDAVALLEAAGAPEEVAVTNLWDPAHRHPDDPAEGDAASPAPDGHGR